MDDIVLTPEEIQAIIKHGAMNYSTFGTPKMRQAIDRDICRAQVRKVADDMTKRGEAGLAALPIGEQGFWKGYWQALIDKGQALKAAGEGK